MNAANLLGTWGESLAAAYLKKKRYAILSTNYRCRFGEIDIIAKTKEFIVFVEVKLRKSGDCVQAREYVGYQKQQRILSTAQYWYQQHPSDLQPRFDVVEIYAPEGMKTKNPEIVHLENAFE